MSGMYVNPTTGAVSSTPPASNPTSTTSSASTSLANQNVFMQLLVAQLQYQDPTDPASGTEFVTQLAEFTNLSNTTQMAGDLGTMDTNLATITAAIPPAATTPPTTPATTNSNNS